MSEEQISPEADVEANSSSGKSLGELIRIAREAKSYSATDLADKLNLSSGIVESIESESFNELPAPAFVRGYLRGIANELALDVDELQELYRRKAQLDPNLSSTASATRQRKSSDPLMVWGTLAILLVLIVMLLAWAFSALSGSNATEERDSDSASTPEVVLPDSIDVAAEQVELALPVNALTDVDGNADKLQEAADSTLAASNVESSEESGNEEVADDSDSDESTTENTIGNNETPASVSPVAPRGSDLLTLNAKGVSWANITDANGFRLVFGLLDNRNKNLVLKGRAPFKVFLGDATQVELSYKGQPVDIKAHTRANNVAKFRVK